MRRALLAVLVFLLALLVVMLLRRHGPIDHRSPSPATPDLGAGAASRARPAPPLRLPSARAVEDAKITSGQFGGRVLSTRDGKPIARASLTFLHEGAAMSTESDAEGRYAVTAATPGAYELTSATAPGFLPFQPLLGHSPVTVQARAGVRLDDVTIYLSPALELVVLVVDDKDKPLPGAEVRAFDEQSGPADAAAVVSDAKGHARLAVRPWNVVEARHAGYRSARQLIGYPAQTSGRLTLHLVPGADRARLSISGRVVDGRGLPVDGALVEAFGPPTLDAGELGAQTLSDADGVFTLAALDDASYDVRATTRTEGSAIARDVRAGARDVELRLGAVTAVLRGTVRDGGGKPITAFTVVAWPRVGVLGRGPDERATVIDAEGRYELPLVPGTYVVAAAARGFARAKNRAVEVGEHGAEADFTLARGSRIFGRVVERGSGTPLPGATVGFEGHALSDEIGLATDAIAAADGSFSLDGLPGGRSSLNVQADKHNGRILAVTVPQEGALGPLAIDLAPTAPGEEPATELIGIGAMLGARPEGMVVLSLTPGGGAAEAGLVAGDTILTIDGQSVEPLGFGGSIQMIRGPEDTIVTLVVKRKDGSVQTIPVRRKRINF